MIRAFDPLGLIANVARHTVQVRGSPSGGHIPLLIIAGAFSVTHRAKTLKTFVRLGMDKDLQLVVCLSKVVAADNFFLKTANMDTIVVEI